MLQIKELKAGIEGNQILKGINLEVKAGEIHAIMGPNGSGKSTLSTVIAGKEEYEVEGGSITFDGKDLLELEPEERAHKGIFLSFQYPVEIPGISVSNFIKTSITENRKSQSLEPLPTKDLLKMMREKMELLSINKG
jgi:Fe-S cluster assembly ATP-binding protein